MGYPTRLRRERMTNATIGTAIDNRVGDLEQALSDILGILIDADITAKAFDLDAAGRNNAQFRQRGAAGTVNGYRCRDITNDSEFLLCANAGYLEIYQNTGTEDVPVWDLVAKLDPGAGWTTGGLQDANLSHNFAAPITTATWTAVPWIVPGGYWDRGSFYNAVNPTRITLGDAGLYRLHAFCYWAANATGTRRIEFRFNGGAVDSRHRSHILNAGATINTTHELEVYVVGSPSGTYYGELYVYQDSGGNLSATPYVYVERLSGKPY